MIWRNSVFLRHVKTPNWRDCRKKFSLITPRIKKRKGSSTARLARWRLHWWTGWKSCRRWLSSIHTTSLARATLRSMVCQPATSLWVLLLLIIHWRGRGRWLLLLLVHKCLDFLFFCFFTPPPIGQRSIVMSVSASLCVFVFARPRSHHQDYTSDLQQSFTHVNCGSGWVLLWRHNHTLCSFLFYGWRHICS